MHRFGWHSGEYWIDKASTTSGNKHGPRGRPPKKTKATPREIEAAKLRNQGLYRREIAEKMGLNEGQVKRALAEAKKFGIVFTSKSGPKKGLPQRGGWYNNSINKKQTND